MTAIGGSIQEISIAGRNFAVAADSDVTRKTGGFENEVSPNGNETARIIKTRVTWGLDGLAVEIDDSRQDQEFLQGIADGFTFVACSITLASNITYQGDGIVSAELGTSTQSATATISIMGQGKLTQQ